MLRLTHHTVIFANLNVAIVTRQLTLTFWLRADALLSSPTAVLEVRTSVGVVTVLVHQRLILLTWLGAGTASLQPDDIHRWTYLAVTWDDRAGSLTAFAIQETGFDYTTFSTGVLSAQDFRILGLSLLGPQTNDDDNAVEVDLLRVWQSAKPLEAIARDLKVYESSPDLDPISSLPVLLMSAAFDEGEGPLTVMSLHTGAAAAAASNVSGVVDAGGQTPSAARSVWRPSTVPLLDVALPEDVFRTPDTTASARACLAALQADRLGQHCGDLHAFLSVYLEACVREHQRTGNANITVAVANLLAFYCQATKEVGECVLDGYVDFCQPVAEEDEFPVWLIIVICVGVLLFTSCCCCFVAFVIHKKKKRMRKARNLTGSVTYLSSSEAETSFCRESSASQGFFGEDQGSIDIDIGFVNPTYGHEDGSAAKDGRRGRRREMRKGRKDKAKVGSTPKPGARGKPKGARPGGSANSRGSSERPGSGFEERPHMEAWTSSGTDRPISGQRGKWVEGFQKDPKAPLGFYTSQDDANVYIYSPEWNQRALGNGAGGMIAALPPQGTHLRPSTREDDPGVRPFRLQSVPDREMVILDELEVEEPAPIVFRHKDDDFEDRYGATSSRMSSRPATRPGPSRTPDKISLAFDED